MATLKQHSIRFRFNPYSFACRRVPASGSDLDLDSAAPLSSRAVPAAPVAAAPLPRAAVAEAAAPYAFPEPLPPAAAPAPEVPLHTQLYGRVRFVPFPAEEFLVPEPVLPKTHLVRIFVGQLPYNVTDMELAWLFATLAEGAAPFHTERIVRKNPADPSTKQPRGCVHTYCMQRDVDALVELVDKRVLFDDCGIWYAENAEQKATLASYCEWLRANRSPRQMHRPYQLVTVQRATSTFVPRSPLQRRSPAGTPPPPPYYGYPPM